MSAFGWWVVFGALAWSGAAFGQSGYANAYGLGGVVLSRPDGVVLERLDIRLSPGQVTLRYAFRNTLGRVIEVPASFVVPEIGVGYLAFTMTSQGNIHRPNSPPDIVGLRVRTDWREVWPNVWLDPVMADGQDPPRELLRLGNGPLLAWPRFLRKGALVPDAYYLDVSDALFDALANAGAVTVLDGGQLADPKWQTRVTYSWQQRLGPGLTELNLAYKPIAGSQWGGGFFKQQEWERTYCLDVRRLPAGMKTETGDVQVDRAVPVHLMLARDVAALGPVGDLRVVVEPTPRVGWMERAQHLAACLQQGMRRVGPTRMELRRRNVSRVEDLQVLFMGTLPP